MPMPNAKPLTRSSRASAAAPAHAWVLALLVGCGGQEVEVEARHPCDPAGYDREVPVPAERAQQTHCGNGRVDEYDLSCTERCTMGCGMAETCSTDCIHQAEPCDGDDLGGATCVDRGFAGGALACFAACAGHDTSGCDACAAPPCRELSLSPEAARGADLELSFIGRGASRRGFVTWTDAEGELVAAPLEGDSLGAPLVLGAVSERWPSVTTSRAMLAAVGTDAGWEVSVLEAGGASSVALGLPEDGGSVRIFAAEAEDGAILTQGELGSNEVRVALLDRRGRARSWPERPVLGVHPIERVLIAPIAPGAHTLRAGTQSLEVQAVRGDRVLVLVHTSLCSEPRSPTFCGASVALVHAGVAFPAIGDVLSDGLVVEAGARRVELSPDTIAIDGHAIWRAASAAPSPALSPIAAAHASPTGLACFDADDDGPAPLRCVLAPSGG